MFGLYFKFPIKLWMHKWDNSPQIWYSSLSLELQTKCGMINVITGDGKWFVMEI